MFTPDIIDFRLSIANLLNDICDHCINYSRKSDSYERWEFIAYVAHLENLMVHIK